MDAVDEAPPGPDDAEPTAAAPLPAPASPPEAPEAAAPETPLTASPVVWPKTGPVWPEGSALAGIAQIPAANAPAAPITTMASRTRRSTSLMGRRRLPRSLGLAVEYRGATIVDSTWDARAHWRRRHDGLESTFPYGLVRLNLPVDQVRLSIVHLDADSRSQTATGCGSRRHGPSGPVRGPGWDVSSAHAQPAEHPRHVARDVQEARRPRRAASRGAGAPRAGRAGGVPHAPEPCCAGCRSPRGVVAASRRGGSRAGGRQPSSRAAGAEAVRAWALARPGPAAGSRLVRRRDGHGGRPRP